MKALRARLKNASGRYELQFLVDKLDWDSLQYKKVDIVYFGEKDGLVTLLQWSAYSDYLPRF